MSLGKKIGAGIPLNEESVKNTPSDSHNNLDDDNNNEDDENDEKSLNQS